MNEQNAPVGPTDQGVMWQSLGIFTMTSNVLHVSTWNSPTDGAICVNGIRIIPVSGVSAANMLGSTATAAIVESDPIPSIPSTAPDLAQWPTQTQLLAAHPRPAPTRVLSNGHGRPTQRDRSSWVDRLDLATLADTGLGPRGGLADLDGSMGSFLTVQVGTNVRRTLR